MSAGWSRSSPITRPRNSAPYGFGDPATRRARSSHAPVRRPRHRAAGVGRHSPTPARTRRRRAATRPAVRDRRSSSSRVPLTAIQLAAAPVADPLLLRPPPRPRLEALTVDRRTRRGSPDGNGLRIVDQPHPPVVRAESIGRQPVPRMIGANGTDDREADHQRPPATTIARRIDRARARRHRPSNEADTDRTRPHGDTDARDDAEHHDRPAIGHAPRVV